jgi:tetratricopeptide (TPR) repeat protein
MAIQGALSDVSLADISQLLGMGGKTGCLTLTNYGNTGSVYFEDGTVIFATVTNRLDRLGDLLVTHQAITRDQLSAAVAKQAPGSGQRLGEVLVELGSLTQEKLDEYIAVQIEEAVYLIFQWNEGTFKFDPDIMPEETVFRVSLSIDGLLMEGARRVDEWSVVEKKITSMDLVFALERNPLEDEGLDLTDDQKLIIPLIDGQRSVMDLVEVSGLVEFDTGKALCGLIQAGFAVQVAKRVGEDEAKGSLEQALKAGLEAYKSGMMDDATRELRKTLEVDPTHAEARAHLALISLRQGKAHEAIVHFDGMDEATKPTYALLRNRSLAYESLGRYAEVLSTLTEAEKLEADDAGLALARGIVQMKSGDGAAAMGSLKVYQDKLGSEKPLPMFYAFSVLAAGLAGDMGRALEISEEGLKQYPGDGAILVNAGAVFEHRGDGEAATACYERAIKGDSPPPQAFKALGDQALGHGDKVQAAKYYELAGREDPRLGEDVFIKLGAIALENSNTEGGAVLWRRAPELNPDNLTLRTKVDQLGDTAGT